MNILSGSRDHVTKYLAEHQNVDAVWYFGSAAGSHFVEHARFELTQGLCSWEAMIGVICVNRQLIELIKICFSAVNVKRTWVDHGVSRDWKKEEQGQGEEFLYHATQVKNVWLTMGDIFAN